MLPESRMLAYLDPRVRGGDGFRDFLRDRQFIGYEPQFSVTRGLDMAAAWYMEREL